MPETHLEDAERQIPLVKGFLFFCPIQQLCKLLNMPTAIKHEYEETKNFGWPTWRTFSKLLDNPAAVERFRPSTLAKMERMVTDKPVLEELRINPEELEFFWQPYHEWTGLIASACLHESISKKYWQSRVDSERDLVAQLRLTVGAHKKLQTLLACDLAWEPGCLLARRDVEDLLLMDPPSGSFEGYPELIRFRLCAYSSMLLRFAAWLVAEWEYLTDTNKAKVPLETFLPQFDPVAGIWSNPVSSFLDYMASRCGCPPDSTSSAFLGKLWADHEYMKDDEGQARGNDIASKQKLLRNWIRGHGGRPEHSSMKALTEAVAHRQASPGEHAFEVLAIGYARALVLLETCREIRPTLSEHGLSNGMIEAVISVFEMEYQKATHVIAEAGADI